MIKLTFDEIKLTCQTCQVATKSFASILGSNFDLELEIFAAKASILGKGFTCFTCFTKSVSFIAGDKSRAMHSHKHSEIDLLL